MTVTSQHVLSPDPVPTSGLLCVLWLHLQVLMSEPATGEVMGQRIGGGS
jgi:hypothetical protein